MFFRRDTDLSQYVLISWISLRPQEAYGIYHTQIPEILLDNQSRLQHKNDHIRSKHQMNMMTVLMGC